MARRRRRVSRAPHQAHSFGPAPRTRRRCGTMEVLERMLEEDPAYRGRLSLFEHDTSRMMAMAIPWRPATIRVVVHVLHKKDSENISDAQIASQIRVLNQDFNRTNPDWSQTPAPFLGLVAAARIKFKLVKVVRKATLRDSFGTNDDVKRDSSGGSNPVKPRTCLNVWVCTLAGGLLGYAQFPGGAVATEGVVVRNTAFGTRGTAKAPFNRGRTATHEVGHWLNLRHIWGDTPDCSGGDGVADTPNCAGPNYGAPGFPVITCNNGPNGDMFMNYMDYVDDRAMFMFSRGQVARMHAALLGPRRSYV
jgi:hypothetical protein